MTEKAGEALGSTLQEAGLVYTRALGKEERQLSVWVEQSEGIGVRRK